MAKCTKVFFLSLMFLSMILLFGSGCRRPDTRKNSGLKNWYTEQRQLYYGIPVQVSFSPKNETLAATVWNYLEKIDDTFNDYKESSEIGLLNNNPKEGGVDVSPQLAHALNFSLELSKTTDGAFDITIGPIRDLWKKAAKDNREPTPKEISIALESCGFEKVSLVGTHLTVINPDLRFDLGGIIKGIAIDHAISLLKENNIQAAMVQIGGETAVFGISMRGKPHVIGIQHPEDLTQLWAAVRDQGHGLSISTSGNYRNPIVIDGKEFYHIIDPRTGIPVDTHVLSVSIVFPKTGKNWLADGLATACAVVESEKSIGMVENHGGEALILIKEDGKVREVKTTGWDSLTRKH